MALLGNRARPIGPYHVILVSHNSKSLIACELIPNNYEDGQPLFVL